MMTVEDLIQVLNKCDKNSPIKCVMFEDVYDVVDAGQGDDGKVMLELDCEENG